MAEADVKLYDFANIFSLAGKVVVVTGGSRGLGLHAASGLLQAGCSKIFITSRKENACWEACDALNKLAATRKERHEDDANNENKNENNKDVETVAIPIAADLSHGKEAERLVQEVAKHTDHVDILLANAGATWGEAFETHPESAFDKVLGLNVKGVFMVVQKFAPLLRQNATLSSPSRVIVTASVAGLAISALGQHATYSYAASKAAAIHLTRHLAIELAPSPNHILCNAICPGFFPSKMANGLMEASGGVEMLARENPNGRVGAPEDFAAAVVYLASRAGAHVNAAVLVLDGGKMWANSRL